MSSILVIDDEVDLRKAVKAILNAEGFDVIECRDGREAMEVIPDLRPDLILLDVMLPFVSGLDVLKFIRSRWTVDEVPVILMTGISPNLLRMTPAWNGVLHKPFGFDELISSIQAALGFEGVAQQPIHPF